FSAINNAKFRKPVVPGDQLRIEVDLVNRKKNYFQIKGTVFVENSLAAEAEMMAAIVDKEPQMNEEL
ncbi:MAG TPA: hypothetical protein ENN33_08325, partial [Ignavibacteria bacterium]|nr:hypothetical protein [Ignavibacteria bacterium]